MSHGKKLNSQGKSFPSNSEEWPSFAEAGLGAQGVATQRQGPPSDFDPRELQNMKDIFQGQIDPAIVEIVLIQCNFNVNSAIESLLKMSHDQPVTQSAYQVGAMGLSNDSAADCSLPQSQTWASGHSAPRPIPSAKDRTTKPSPQQTASYFAGHKSKATTGDESSTSASMSWSHATAHASVKPKTTAASTSTPPPSYQSKVRHLPGGKVLCLMRGCPGSGKTTMARKLVSNKGKILSTDDYFMSDSGYQFDTMLLEEAHNWNRKRAEESMQRGVTPIIIDNTNSQSWEMKPYVVMATKYRYHVEFREPNTPWKFNPNQLARMTVHGVPVLTIKRIIDRYEKNVTFQSVLHAANRMDSGQEKLPRGPGGWHQPSSAPQGVDNEPKDHADNSSSNEVTSIHTSLQPKENRESNHLDSNEAGTINDGNSLVQSLLVSLENMEANAVADESADDDQSIGTKIDMYFNSECADSKDVVSTNTTELVDTLSNQVAITQISAKKLPDENIGRSIEDYLDSIESDGVTSDRDLPVKPGLEKMPGSSLPLEKAKYLGIDQQQHLDQGKSGSKRMAAVFNVPPIEPHVKEQATRSDWMMPRYPLEPHFGAGASPSAASKATWRHKRFEDKAVGTNYSDFVFLLNVELGSAGETEDRILTGRYDPSVRVEPPAEERPAVLRMIAMFDKSCMTDDLQAEVNPADEMEFLQSCFPSISEENLRDLLLHCGGDSQWLSGILSESVNLPILEPSSLPRNDDRSAAKDTKPSEPQPSFEQIYGGVSGSGSVDPGHAGVKSSSLQHKLPTLAGKVVLQQEESSAQLVVKDTKKENQKDLQLKEEQKRKMTSKTMKETSKQYQLGKTPMLMSLDPVFALQLQELFGPVGFHLSPDSFSGDDLNVSIDYKMAKQIHQCWAATILKNFDEEQTEMDLMMKEDEELARKLQREWDEKNTNENFLKRSPKKTQKYFKAMALDNQQVLPSLPQEASVPFQEIMEEDLATELSKFSQKTMGESQTREMDLAAKMKLAKLCQIFPKINRGILIEVFESTNYNFEETVKVVERRPLDPKLNPEPSKTVVAPQLREELERLQLQLEAAQAEPKAAISQATSEAAGSGVEDSGDEVMSLDDPDYGDFRAEATAHFKKRQEYFEKAAAAYQRGQKQLAAFYSQQGHLQSQYLKEANEKAKNCIVDYNNRNLDNNVLDLHGLHVNEAIECLQDVLDQKESVRSHHRGHYTHLQVITGRGNHSYGGMARIKPAISDYLRRKGYQVTEPHDGLLKVLLKFKY